MKRRLIVLRHAKSSWSTGEPDHARPLNSRGRRTAPFVGEALQRRGWAPQIVLSSDSLRTQMTVEGVCSALSPCPELRFTRHLYLAGVDEARRELPTVPDDIDTVLLVGHNPGWEALICWLSGQLVTMKTADCALLEGRGDTWTGAVQDPNSWTLMEFMKGRNLAG